MGYREENRFFALESCVSDALDKFRRRYDFWEGANFPPVYKNYNQPQALGGPDIPLLLFSIDTSNLSRNELVLVAIAAELVGEDESLPEDIIQIQEKIRRRIFNKIYLQISLNRLESVWSKIVCLEEK